MARDDRGDGAAMHLVIASDQEADADALRVETDAQGLDWRVSWLPLDDGATVAPSTLEPDILVCASGTGWARCQGLLDEVRAHRPQAVRMVVMEPGQIARAVQLLEHAHRVLPEPLDPLTVVEAAQALHELQGILADPELRAAIEHARPLPAAPRLYLALTRLLRDPDVDAAAVTAVVSQDPALAARVLRLSNSAYYATGREIGDLRTAVVRLGGDALRRLVLAGEVFASSHDIEVVRERAMRASWLAAQLLPGAGADLAATAGLLANVDRLLPGKVFEGGITPGVAGAYMLGLWGLPEVIVEAVAWQHAPARVPGPFWIAGAVHVATALVDGTPVDEAYLRRTGRMGDLPKWKALAAGGPAGAGHAAA